MCHCDSISRELEDGSYEELSYQDIVDKLNENQQLKQKNERLSRVNEAKREQIKFHVDGYNQLKEVNKHSEETVKKQHELIKQLSQENCKIHAIIREAVNTERTELGQRVLKNLADNIGVEY